MAECRTCYGFGMWATGYATPMDQVDAEDGMPTIACPACGVSANPRAQPAEGTQESISLSQSLSEVFPGVHPLERGLYLTWLQAVEGHAVPESMKFPGEMRGEGIANNNKLIKRGKKKI